MSKLTAGGKLPDFTYCSPFAAEASISDTAGKIKGKTALVFLRYYGCPMCQYDIHEFAVHHDQITAAGGQMLVVLQSDPAKLAAQLSPEDLPFEIICDPEQKLYHAFEIAPAASVEEMLDEASLAKIEKVKAAGLQHGDYEGEEQQLPAAFVVEPDLTLTYAHYGKALGDVPTPEELAELLR